ncbi:hypothetical protein BaRGS_00018394 [Batillaria attramentaria]|uniref:Uncharacterized protein n=1 Tax=Batillaria attramentaria TaxID=370345 RepID=A0ABD0KTA1_9CAEN
MHAGLLILQPAGSDGTGAPTSALAQPSVISQYCLPIALDGTMGVDGKKYLKQTFLFISIYKRARDSFLHTPVEKSVTTRPNNCAVFLSAMKDVCCVFGYVLHPTSREGFVSVSRSARIGDPKIVETTALRRLGGGLLAEITIRFRLDGCRGCERLSIIPQRGDREEERASVGAWALPLYPPGSPSIEPIFIGSLAGVNV